MPKVLIVEDSASMRAYIRAILEDEVGAATLGTCVVTEASSGFEAMRLLPRGPYDLIVTDINMGNITGLELIRFVRKSEHHKTTPLLIVSTQHTERDVERGLSLGADGFLPKPFTADQLRAACVEVLTSSKNAKNKPNREP